MKFSSIFPSEHKFYGFMELQAAHALTCAQHLKTFLESRDQAERDRADAAIDAQRDEAKKLSGQITSELCRSFITPFDREDIQDFADLMYKVPKIIEKIKDRIKMHGISLADGDFSRQVDLIILEATVTKELVQALIGGKGAGRVTDHINRLRDLEQQGDDIRNELLVSLFKSDRDIRDLILRRDIYDMLEKVVDRFRDTAGVALQIVLKHS